MTKRLISALVLFLFVAGCASAPSTPPPSSAAGTTVANPPDPATLRSVSLSSIENSVDARAEESASFAPASNGDVLVVGGQVQTGADGRVRLDLLPEGTIVRLAPNSQFTLSELSSDPAAPKSKLKLAFGKVWVLLSGGTLEVETPSGVAAVRGSLLSIQYDPDTKSITVECREGHCELSDEDEDVELTTGQAIDSVDGDIADAPRDMTEEEFQDWEQQVPETDQFMADHPEGTDVPPTDIVTEVPTESPAATQAPTDAPVDPSAGG